MKNNYLLIRHFCNLKSRMTDSQRLNLDSIIRHLPPALSEDKHKGQAGRIGIIGGSPEYTGAPYFAGMTALRCGADLVYVFCAKDAAGPIKSYAPELIVLPYLDDEHGYDLIVPRLTNLHSLIVGPGLGENEQVHSVVLRVLKYMRENEKISSSIPLVFDADGIGLLAKHKEILCGYKAPVYVTPNKNEIKKLTSAYLGYVNVADNDCRTLQTLVQRIYGNKTNATIILKGPTDTIVNYRREYDCCVAGSSRRVGGQGDLLSGSLGLFSYWASLHRETEIDNVPTEIIASYSACVLTRLCNKLAYMQKGRSMITSDMINQVKNAFELCFNS